MLCNLALHNAGPGYKCHLGGNKDRCCENDGEGPICKYNKNNGCNPNSLNEGKECDKTLGNGFNCVNNPKMTKNSAGMNGYAGSAEFTLIKDSGTF